jgi:hypothetical protein
LDVQDKQTLIHAYFATATLLQRHPAALNFALVSLIYFSGIAGFWAA